MGAFQIKSMQPKKKKQKEKQKRKTNIIILSYNIYNYTHILL